MDDHGHGDAASSKLYHEGARALQDHFDSRRIADRLEEVTFHDDLSEDDAGFIESCAFFFLATADADGRPDVSYKGGLPGFVRSLDAKTVVFPSYDGNGMFRTLGNVLVNPEVAMLFIDFADPGRLRVHGRATLSNEDPLMSEFEGAQLIVRVAVDRVFPNCPRYIHRMTLEEPSPFAPREGHVPPVPGWKRAPVFAPHLPKTAPPKKPLPRVPRRTPERS
ncbi:MAG TPA: pyridoxamine 5'-phosphate oxidase family protein [Candidatus Thermoplasmatota archaeon]|nr:pyridoxamine 5'-phosphate oxidase family protein [Candidatus Thermoplasmatota archaeon]